MNITFNGAEHEKTSPFCIKNQEFCEKWESLFLENGGEVKGRYNATSFLIDAKVKLDNTWVFRVTRGTMTSGNLILSSEAQNVKKWSTIKSDIDLGSKSFQIKEKSEIGLIKRLFSSMAIQKGYPYQGYSTISHHKFKVSPVVIEGLQSYFTLKSVKEIVYNGATKRLTIEVRDLIEDPITLINEIEKVIEKVKKENDFVFFHEDDYCQVQILPKENWNSLLNQCKAIDEFSENNKATIGYSDMYVREDEESPLLKRAIPVEELDTILSKLNAKRYTNVKTGYGSYGRPCDDTIGYNKENSAIYYSFKNEVVEDIWLDYIGDFNPDLLSKVLDEVGKKWELILVDWNELVIVDLINKEHIHEYLNHNN